MQTVMISQVDTYKLSNKNFCFKFQLNPTFKGLLLAHVNRVITETVLSAKILTNVKIRLATKMRFVKIRMVM